MTARPSCHRSQPLLVPPGEPARQPHEYLRDGTAKVVTLSHPADGHVRVEGVTTCPNPALHGWLKRELAAVLATIPAAAGSAPRGDWEMWQEGLTIKPTLPDELPPPRVLPVLDNLAGHKTPEFVCWLFEHGVMPLYTPVGGSWLNMAEGIQRVLKRRALDGQHPSEVGQILAWFKSVAEHWNAASTPFGWGGKRAARRRRQRERRHRPGAPVLAPGSRFVEAHVRVMATSKLSDPLGRIEMLHIFNEPMTVEAHLAELRSMLIEIKAAILTIQGNSSGDRTAYTVQEAADLLGKGTYTVRQWCLEGRINATKRAEKRGGTEVWNISAVEIERYRNEGLLPVVRARLAG